MPKIIKAFGKKATETDVKRLVGKLIHVPTNTHTVSEGETVNAWFAGQVAGYEKAYITYDFDNGDFVKKPQIFFNVLLTDGKGYLLSLTDSEIFELTDSEWTEMVAEHNALTALREVGKDLILPERKIILPNEVK